MVTMRSAKQADEGVGPSSDVASTTTEASDLNLNSEYFT